MSPFNPVRRFVAAFLALFCLCAVAAAQPPSIQIADAPVPSFETGLDFHFQLHANGGAPPYTWTVANGELPEGLTLSREGLLSGRPTKSGDFNVTVEVEESAHPPRTATKQLRMSVSGTLLLEWLDFPKAHDGRIDGSLQISNGSKDTFDLTVIVVAVAENGRATAIGYEHFPMNPGTNNLKVPFGNTLPHGGYAIHADAIGEIADRNAILRQRLQTQPLQVVQGP